MRRKFVCFKVNFKHSKYFFGIEKCDRKSLNLIITQANGEPYFPTFVESYWELYVLATTANSPDIMMPAYEANPWYVKLRM